MLSFFFCSGKTEKCIVITQANVTLGGLLNHIPPAKHVLWWSSAHLYHQVIRASYLVEYVFDFPSFQNRQVILFWKINYFIEYWDCPKRVEKIRLLKINPVLPFIL